MRDVSFLQPKPKAFLYSALRIVPVRKDHCAFFIVCSLALLLSACSSDESRQRGKTREIASPEPPAFLAGPSSVLLTNARAFSAKVTVEFPGSPIPIPPMTGQLLGQYNHLVFAPTRSDRTFMWDTAEQSGWVMSEALQGYAPVTPPVRVTATATVSETAGPSSQRVNGHPGHEVEMALLLNDGSTAHFRLWRAADLDGFPVRIQSLTATKPFILNLSDIASTTLSSNLFIPPDGFTKYASSETMANELMYRRAKPKKSETPSLDEVIQKPPNAHPRY